MKKTQRKKLALNATTVRTLATQQLDDVHGAFRNSVTCRFCPAPAPFTQASCSCGVNSVCNSCNNSDCCLEIP